jgi:hypothetical protein
MGFWVSKNIKILTFLTFLDLFFTFAANLKPIVMKNILFIVISLALLAGCDEENVKQSNVKHDALYFFNDFENVRGWGEAFTITKGKGHSGMYYSKIDSIHQFSYGFKMDKNSIYDKELKKVSVNVWILAKDPNTKAVLVAQVNRKTATKDSSIYWQKAEIQKFKPQASVWTNVKASFDLPKNLQPKDNILFYVWNSDGKSEVDVDDLEVQFYK